MNTQDRLPKAEYFAQRLTQARNAGDSKKVAYYESRLASLNPVLSPFEIVHKVIMFGFNYNAGFIQEVWGETSIGSHLQAKFSNLYSRHGMKAVMFCFYTELSQDNQQMLVQYIMDTYQ